jgi:protein-tyrosine phosphatase
MSNKIDKIIDNLYIGNYDSALDQNIIESYKIDVIINCTKKTNRTILQVEYLQIPIDDPPSDSDINYVNSNFIFITDYIYDKIKSGKNVLVHCVMGSQRSAAIVAIYLMRGFNQNYKNTIQYMKSKRPICFFGKVNYLDSLIYAQNQLDIKV